MGLWPQPGEAGGTPQLHIWGDKCGESARRVQGTGFREQQREERQTPPFYRGVWSTPHPHPRARQCPDQAHSEVRPEAVVRLQTLPLLTRHPRGCFLHKPPEPAEC